MEIRNSLGSARVIHSVGIVENIIIYNVEGGVGATPCSIVATPSGRCDPPSSVAWALGQLVNTAIKANSKQIGLIVLPALIRYPPYLGT